jgi:hypothetical protein
MGDRNKNSKEGKEPRRIARQTGKTCGRPFKAPRPVTQAVTDIVRVTETLLQDSDKDEMTDTREDRRIRSVGSTPDCCKSPEIIQGRVPGSNTSDTTSGFRIEERTTQSRNKYKG